MVAAALLFTQLAWADSAPLQVAITIDDLPWNGVMAAGETPRSALQRIAATLRVHEAPAMGFVTCGGAAEHENAIREWIAWGNPVGNHSTQHQDLNRTPLDIWMADVAQCHEYLKRFGAAHSRYFRYPLLHEGRTPEVRDAVVAGLERLGLTNARVTVDTSDWLLATAYGHALEAGDGARRLAIARDFVRHVRAAVSHADAVAQRKLNRRVPLVLLLHANSLVANHLDEALLALRDDGVKFVTLDEALADPVYSRQDEYAGPKGLSWLYRMHPASVSDVAWDDAEATAIRERYSADAAASISHLSVTAKAPVGMDTVVSAASESERMRALLVMQGGEIHAEAYFNGAGPEHAQNLKSVTKTLLSALVGVAMHEGWIEDLDVPISRFLPGRFADGHDDPKGAITVRELLTMSSGLEPVSYGAIQGSDDWTGMILTQSLSRSEPQQFHYDTPVLNLLSEVLVAASGMSLTEMTNRKLFAGDDAAVAYWRTDAHGIELGGNDAYLTPRALLTLGELYRMGGVRDGRRIIDEGFVRESVMPQIMPAERTINHDTLPIRGYGFLWWLPADDKDQPYAALGHGGQLMLVYPRRELVVVITSRWPGDSSTDHYHHLARLVDDSLLPLYP